MSLELEIRHTTTYTYLGYVTDGYNEVRLRPVTDDPGRLLFHMLVVQPPVRLKHFRDVFYNHVHWFEMPEPHTYLSINSTLRVRTTNPYEKGLPQEALLSDMPAALVDELRPFLESSTYVEIDPDVWRAAMDIKGDETGVFATCLALMNHIHREWTYESGSTSVSTHMRDVLQSRKGVCQDFAHAMIGYGRALGIPIRYVSGYLYSDEGHSLRGFQASHAWCEIWMPGQGWFGLDPTNGLKTDDRFVKIATGRDYADAAPVTGHFKGPLSATVRMEVSVDIELL